MLRGKGHYLKQLTAQTHIQSAEVGTELEGSTPPSVFIGSWNYPKVWAGPMMTPCHGDTAIYDSPEQWIPEHVGQERIIGYRVNLVRGKKAAEVTDVENRFVEKLQEIALSAGSIDGEASFTHEPRGFSISDEHMPHGPSAVIEDFRVDGGRWDGSLEKVYYDGDLKAADAMMELYGEDVPFSRMQKALSVGAMGDERKRRLVPTRWSITACDTTLANRLLAEVRHMDVLDCHQVYEFDSLNNHYAVILTPTAWQYEWTEAFLHIIGNEELIFSDHETNLGKKGYSSVGGCYYSCKFAVLEALARMGRQAGAIVLREAYRGYVPLGVFNVRENVRAALTQPPTEFESLPEALTHVGGGMRLPIEKFIAEGRLLKDLYLGRQSNLKDFS